jgi:hypothetical protein
MSRCVMSDDDKPARSWQDIVEAASHEKDQEKLKDLAEELELALDRRAESFSRRKLRL